ncbi:MAG: SGNH/GDSL hydrolase family protein [Planctomycetes bacterium]|nr:SGNH/GDSL hydrolase family protein [Planctomycetota bacterium]
MSEPHHSSVTTRSRGWAAAVVWSVFSIVGVVAGLVVLVAKDPTPLVATSAAAAVGAHGIGAVLLVRRRHRVSIALGSLRILRLLAYVWFCAVGAASLAVAMGWVCADKYVERTFVMLVASALQGVFVLSATLRPGAVAAWFRRLRALDVTMGVLVLSLVGLEAVLLLWGRLWPSPLVWDETSTVARLEAERLPPHTKLFGFSVNSGGYHDLEFFAREPDDLLVCVVADSFGVGVVPYDYNFVTVAERSLADAVGADFDRVAIHNFGVASTGVQQYVYLVDHEVLALDPDLVVVAIFIGNDVLHGGLRNEPRKYSTFQRWAFWRVTTRAIRRQRVLREQPALAAIGTSDIETPPFLDNPDLEPPHMTTAQFLALERERFDVVRVDRPDIAEHYDRLFLALDYLQHRLRDRLLVVLIPDEFQVDDALFDEIVAADPSASQCDREAPNGLVREQCERLDISVLDLLPTLRAHVRSGGARPYHLRDTHWNAVGNRIAGEALAAWLSTWVRSRGR